MRVSELQELFLQALAKLLSEWKFVKSKRSFVRKSGPIWHHFHISCINHETDFDAVGDVAIEIRKGRERLCVVGAELGNIAGIGQRRFSVHSAASASVAAHEIQSYFVQVGEAFFERYSRVESILETLREGGKEAMLICPFEQQRDRTLKVLEAEGSA